MRSFALFAVLLLASCGPPEEKFEYTCYNEYVKVIQSHKPINCKIAKYNASVVVKGAYEAGFADASSAAQLQGKISITIKDADHHWIDAYNRDIAGEYIAETKTIELARDMKALGCESLHAYEAMKGIETTWSTNPEYRFYLNWYRTNHCSLIESDNVGLSYCAF